MAWDPKEYAAAAAVEAGKVGRFKYAEVRHELAEKGSGFSGRANVWPFRHGSFATRMNLTTAIDRLYVRSMTAPELSNLDAAMRDAISDAHRAVTGDDLVTESGEADRKESENLCIQKLELLIATGSDKLRLGKEERNLRWKLTILSVVFGLFGGVLGSLLLKAFT